MKVAFFLGAFPVASETFVINQIIGLMKLGHQVEIIALAKGDLTHTHSSYKKFNLANYSRYLLDEESNDSNLSKLLNRFVSTVKGLNLSNVRSACNANVYGAHSKSLLLPAIISNLDKPIESDVILCHFGVLGVIANKLQKLGLISGRVYTIFHGADISQTDIIDKFGADYEDLFKSSEGILPISNLWKNKLIKMGCDSAKVSINRMGINPSEFTLRDHDQPLNQCLQMVSVARFTEKKGLVYAIEAAAILKNRGLQFKYKIVGGGTLEGELKQLIVELNLTDCVEVLGFRPQEEITEILDQSDIFILPSVTATNGDMEGIPVALMESMAVGLITVSTFHSGIPELIDDKKSGFLVDEKNKLQIADIVERIIKNEFNLPEIRLNAREKIVSDFNQEKLYQKLANILSSNRV